MSLSCSWKSRGPWSEILIEVQKIIGKVRMQGTDDSLALLSTIATAALALNLLEASGAHCSWL